MRKYMKKYFVDLKFRKLSVGNKCYAFYNWISKISQVHVSPNATIITT